MIASDSIDREIQIYQSNQLRMDQLTISNFHLFVNKAQYRDGNTKIKSSFKSDIFRLL